jgi:hypothetical protein
MRELGCEKLDQELASFAAGLEGYWGYYQRAEAVYQQLLARYPREVVQALACGWQLPQAGHQQQRLPSQEAPDTRSRVLFRLCCAPT